MAYTWEGMTKISYEEAIEMHEEGREVYKLYDDDTEGLAENLAEIHAHNEYGGEFGIE